VRWIGFPTSSSDSGSEIEALPPRAGEGFKNSAGRKGATFGPTIASAAATQHARPKLAKELVELQSIYKYLFAATHEPAVGHDS